MTVYSIGGSTSANDNTITLNWTPSGEGQIPSSMSLSVDYPFQLLPVTSQTGTYGITGASCDNPPQGTNGYQTIYAFTVLSYFGQAIAGGVYANEAFSGADTPTYTGTNWPAVGPLTDHAAQQLNQFGFVDQICVLNPNGNLIPAPYFNGTSSGPEVDWREQAWYVGSPTSGQGVMVSNEQLQRYHDHGAYYDFQSPAP